MFSVSKTANYLIGVIVIMVISYVGTLYKQSFETMNNDEYELIRKYLLNDSPLYGFNKPKLWIHTKYEYNARDWEFRVSLKHRTKPAVHSFMHKDHYRELRRRFPHRSHRRRAFSKLIPLGILTCLNWLTPLNSECENWV
jgi:hypothetical protein